MIKEWRYLTCDQNVVDQLQATLQIHPSICQILAHRKIETFEAAKKYFRSSEKDLHDPFLMKDMQIAVDRILLAIEKRKNINLWRL